MDRTIIISFGIAGIVIYLILIAYVIFSSIKKIDINSLLGYRTRFSMSSKEAWEWSNKVFTRANMVMGPLLLVTHIVMFVLSLVYSWRIGFVTLTMFGFMFLFLFEGIYIEIVGRFKFPIKKNGDQ